ncbi:hypothetical protein D7V81_14420, partial [bacterium 1XD21-70]
MKKSLALPATKRAGRQKGNRTGRQAPLAKYFPNVRSRNEVIQIIHSRKDLRNIFYQWNKEEQDVFLDCCTGARGMKVLYDGIFKEVFNPEAVPERLEGFLTLLMKREVRVNQVLPNDSVRLGAESSLLYTDIIIQLEDGSLANVEVQKIGYAFPGERSACYSADHLLRQYKRVRGEMGKKFNYRNIKNVYTVVFFEQSPEEFHCFPGQWIHVFRQKSDTGLFLELLQEYYFIPLDIFRETMENKRISSELEAWLSFLCYDEPERIEELITGYPKFKAMYGDIFEVCRNMEKVMDMYSKELQELDHNTVLYMIDEMQERLNEKKTLLKELDGRLKEQDARLKERDARLKERDAR